LTENELQVINLALFTAYNNDLINNEARYLLMSYQILLTLSKEQSFPKEEELINYSILPVKISNSR
jgi:hypothetical protein